MTHKFQTNKPAVQYGSKVTISDKAEALGALHKELKDLEKTQLEVGEKVAELVFQQVRLAEKTRLIMASMEKLIGQNA